MMPPAVAMPGPFELILLAMFFTVPLALVGVVAFLIVQSNRKKK